MNNKNQDIKEQQKQQRQLQHQNTQQYTKIFNVIPSNFFQATIPNIQSLFIPQTN
jgi:hypothetical protein